MRRLSAVVLLVVAGCAEPPPIMSDDPTPALMAAALVQVVTVDHTFGVDAPTPFTEFVVQDRTDPEAGAISESPTASSRSLSDAEKGAIEEALSEYGPVAWGNPSSESTGQAAYLGVGEPMADGDDWLVPVSMVCGNTCGTWLTYRLESVGDEWVVTGFEGPVAVS